MSFLRRGRRISSREDAGSRVTRRFFIFIPLFLALLSIIRSMATVSNPSPDSRATVHLSDFPQAQASHSSRILLYITTHFSEVHLRYFYCCWPILVKNSPLIRQAHVLVVATNSTPIPQHHLEYLNGLFAHNPSYRFWTPPNADHLAHCQVYNQTQPNGKVSVNYKQCLANYGVVAGLPLILPTRESNPQRFPFDWMVRLNPDVLIRQSRWLLESMTLNSTLQAILIHCGPGTKQIHTDFWAIRPQIIAPNNNATVAAFSKMAKAGSRLNHERTAFREFRGTLADATHQWVPGVEPSQGICRARGVRSPVYHEHDSCLGEDMKCYGLEGWDLAS